MQETFHHICTKGLKDTDLFKDEEDFIRGRNDIAIAFCLGKHPVRIGLFNLMSNHLHIGADGRTSDCKEGMLRFLKLYSMHYSRKYGTAKIFRHISFEVKPYSDSDLETIKRIIGYIFRNPIKHNVSKNAFIYPWSSLKSLFNYNDIKEDREKIITNLSLTSRQLLLKTREDIPSSWEITESGIITLKSFIDSRIVEETFRTMSSLAYYINKNFPDEEGYEVEDNINDTEARRLILQIAKREFGIEIPDNILSIQKAESDGLSNKVLESAQMLAKKRNAESIIRTLTDTQKEQLRTTLRWQFGVNASVIKRILGQ